MLVHQDDGRTLTGDLRGHEHFGYKDGISQPGVKDFHREDRDNPGFRENRAGAVMVEPGEFVFGHKSESGNAARGTQVAGQRFPSGGAPAAAGRLRLE